MIKGRYTTASIVVMTFGLLVGSQAHAAERYYMILFAAEGRPDHHSRTPPAWSHSFATFAREAVGPSGRPGRLVEAFTISWLPARGHAIGTHLTMPRLRTVPGNNYNLRDTAQLLPGRRIWQRGPVRVTAQFYRRAVTRWRYLEAGEADYQLLPGLRPKRARRADRGESDGVANCITALAGIQGHLPPAKAWGRRANENLLEFFRDKLIEADISHEWVAEDLRISERLPIEDR